MLARRILAAILVVAPTAVAAIVLVQWAPLPDPVTAQWAGGEATSTQPLWLTLLPSVLLSVLGLGLAIATVVSRDRSDPFRGTMYVAALLTATSAGLCIAIFAMNFGYASSTGAAFLSALALGPIYALLPMAVVAVRKRQSKRAATAHQASESTEVTPARSSGLS